MCTQFYPNISAKCTYFRVPIFRGIIWLRLQVVLLPDDGKGILGCQAGTGVAAVLELDL